MLSWVKFCEYCHTVNKFSGIHHKPIPQAQVPRAKKVNHNIHIDQDYQHDQMLKRSVSSKRNQFHLPQENLSTLMSSSPSLISMNARSPNTTKGKKSKEKIVPKSRPITRGIRVLLTSDDCILHEREFSLNVSLKSKFWFFCAKF